MNRREFIASVSAFGLDAGFARASSAVTRPEGEVRLKVGILSDIHVTNRTPGA